MRVGLHAITRGLKVLFCTPFTLGTYWSFCRLMKVVIFFDIFRAQFSKSFDVSVIKLRSAKFALRETACLDIEPSSIFSTI